MKMQDLQLLAVTRSCRVLSAVALMALLLPLVDAGSSRAEVPADGKTVPPHEFVTTQGPVELTTRVDREVAQVAQAIKLTLIAQAPQGVSISFPAVPEQLGTFEIKTVEEMLDIPTANGRRSTRTYELESLIPGEHKIPQIDVSYIDTRRSSKSHQIAKSSPANVVISSLLEGQTDPTQFRDIKGIVQLSPPANEHHYWLLGIVAAAMFAGASFAVTFILSRDRELSAKQWAQAELDRLAAQRMAAEIGAAEFYTLVTDIVRSFIERRFDIAAPRFTSAEFFRRVEGHHQLTAYLRPLRSFLTTADMVKFAGLEPLENDCNAAIDKARQFIEASTATPMKEGP